MKKEKLNRNSFSIRIGNREEKMIYELKTKPYYINMSEYLRGSIENLYYEKTGKKEKM